MHKGTGAHVALVPPLAGVRPDVDQQVVLPLEPLMALGTLVGPIGRWHKRDRFVVLEVGHHMLFQLVGTVETEGADFALPFRGGR